MWRADVDDVTPAAAAFPLIHYLIWYDHMMRGKEGRIDNLRNREVKKREADDSQSKSM